MSRGALIVVVGLAAYAALNVALSIAVGAAWFARFGRGSRLSPAARARTLVAWRALPCAGASLLTLAIVVPAFAIFEPYNTHERPGPLVMALAAAGVAQLAAAMFVATATITRTRNLARAWLRAGTPIDVHPPAGVPVYAIDSLAPIVALVGVFSPKLVAARSVIAACTVEELRSIVAHERGHLQARDNLKRWLMACAPDALRWSAVHRDIEAAWHDAAEDAADDVAAGADARARVTLAALLVKIASLTPQPEWPAAAISPFVEKDGLPRRVQRLVGAATPAATRAHALPWLAGAAGLAVALLASSPAALEDVFNVVEALVAFGR